MARSHVLLDPVVRLVPIKCAGGSGEAIAFAGDEAVPDELLRTIYLIPVIVDPPGISTLNLHVPASLRRRRGPLRTARVESTDGNLVVIYAGNLFGEGYYLIFDALKNSLAVIPGPDCRTIGPATVVKSGDHGDYVLALLARNLPASGMSLLLWWSSSSEWVKKHVRTPAEVLDLKFFSLDTSFLFGDEVYWVDLLLGILVLDMSEAHSSVPILRFIPLPQGYKTRLAPHKRGSPNLSRTIGCAGGFIKFLSVDGYRENICPEQVTVTTWTLNFRLEEFWQRDEGTSLRMSDLWEDKSFHSDGLPRHIPLCPVLSSDGNGIVYFFLNNAYPQDVHWMICVNMGLKEVRSCSKCPLGSTRTFPTFLHSTFSSYIDTPECDFDVTELLPRPLLRSI